MNKCTSHVKGLMDAVDSSMHTVMVVDTGYSCRYMYMQLESVGQMGHVIERNASGGHDGAMIVRG